MDSWYLYRNGENYGPYSIKQLQEIARNKTLIKDDLIFQEGKDEWVKEQVFEKWLSERAVIVFKEIVDKVYENISMYDISYPEVSIKKMKTRWGRFNKEFGKINFNRDLIKAMRRVKYGYCQRLYGHSFTN